MVFINSKAVLIRHCVQILDTIYSRSDCVDYITAIYTIEKNLFNDAYTCFESFKNDLLKISELSCINWADISINIKKKVIEEYCNLPMYLSIQVRKNSSLYFVNIKKFKELHLPLVERINGMENTIPIHRLYIAKNKEFLINVENNVNSILSIFFDVKIQVLHSDPEFCNVAAHAVVVHPLGEFYDSKHAGLEGFIKVKVITVTKINSMLSTKLTKELFHDGRSEVVRKIETKPIALNLEEARENEMKRQFIYTIASSRDDIIKSYNDTTDNIAYLKNKKLPFFKDYTQQRNNSLNIESIKSKCKMDPTSSTNDAKAPNLYQSASKMLRLLTSQEKPSVASYWEKLKEFCIEKDASIVLKNKYSDIITNTVDAGGYFKHVYFIENRTVVQIFQRSTTSQRVTEIACLLKLRDEEHIGRIKEMIHDDYGIEVIGLTMEKYDMTLRQYISKNSKPRLTVFQRMDIIIQMLKSIRSAHGMGIAHRDLSTVNFMVNTQSEENKFLPDGSIGVELFLIDFGKAIFFFQDDAEKWWVNTNEQNIYKDEMKPKTKEELVIWCKNLPYIMARPDHGYRFYRSIQTLPRTQKDHRILPYLIHPAAEDIYSLGTLVWKIFSGMEPWPGVFDTDLKKLRETVCEDYIIDNLLEREMPGPISKKFLQKFLRVRPEDRRSAAEILTWLEQPDVNIALLDEWNMQENRSLTKSRIESVIYLRSPTSTVSTATIPAAELSSRENHKSMTSSSKMPTAPSSRKRAGIEWEKEADVPIVKRRKTRGRSKRCKTSQQVDDKPQPKKRGRPKGSRNKIQHVRFSPNRKYSKRHIQDELLKSINLDNHENISNEETKDVIEERTINLDNDFANNDSANDTVTFSEKEKETIQETSIDLETNIIHSDDHEHKVIKSNEISKTIEANLETSKEIEVISNINMADQTLLNSIDPDRTVTEGFTETMDKQDITSEISPSSPKPSTYINHKSASLSEQKTADLLVETTLPDSHKSAKITVDEGLSKITEKSLENQCIDSELNTPVPELIAPVNTNQTATEKEQASLNDQDNNIPKKKRRLNKLKDKVDELSNKIETICTESDKTNNGAVKKARKARKSNTLAKSTISSDTSKNIRNLDGPTIIRIPNFNLLASRNTEIQIQDINDQYTAHQTQDINDQATAHQSQKTIIQLGDTVDTSSDSQVAQSDDNSMNTTILPDKSIVENEDTVVHSQNTEMTKYQSVQTQGTIDQTLYYNTFNTDRPKPKRGRPRKNPVK